MTRALALLSIAGCALLGCSDEHAGQHDAGTLRDAAGAAGEGGSGNRAGAGGRAEAGRSGTSGSSGQSGASGSSASSGRGGRGGGGGASDAGRGSSDTAGRSNAGSGGSGGASAGVSGGGAGSFDPKTPLIERPRRAGYDCSVTRAPEKLGLNPWSGAELLADDTDSFLLRGDGEFTNHVTWSTIGFDGMLGGAQTVRTAANSSYAGAVTAVRTGNAFTLAWSETQSASQIWLAQVSAAGALLVPPHQLAITAGFDPYVSTLVATAAGSALLYAESNGAGASVRLAFLDAEGKPSGAAKTLVTGAMNYQPLHMVATPGGFAVAYASFEGSGWVAHYQAFDARGEKVGVAAPLAGGEYEARLIARGDEVLVAWSARGNDAQDKQHVTISVARFGADGAQIGPSYALQASVVDQGNTGPRWLDMGADVGLVWGKGTIIYICGGCYPDDKLEFVVLDGTDLTPKSLVLELASPLPQGLTGASLLRRGNEILIAASITYHVSREGASAKLRCEPL